MDRPFNPPGQDDLLREHDVTDAPLSDEADMTKELPSVDDILREFSAPLGEIAEDAPEASDGDLTAFPAQEEALAEPLPAAEEPAPEEAAEFPSAARQEDEMTDEASGEAPLDDILREFGAPDAEAPAEPLPEELPALYPIESFAAPEEEGPPTVVARPAQKQRPLWRKVLRVLGVIGKYLLAIVIALAIAVAGLFGYLTLAEYNPAHAELAERGAVNVSKKLDQKTITVLTMNTGYAALGEDADFFMDGGKGVRGESEDQVRDNMLGIEEILRSADADFIFLQEVDTDSDRSFGLNQWLQYEHDLEDYETRFALNYSCDYVPYPLPKTIGKVHSGITTFSRYDISSATRYSLPCPFSWPTRIANLKRCMLVTRIPLEDMDGRELVLVNFHLEAYDDGEGKAAQTEQLMAYLREEYEKGNFVIAGGDFNQCFPGTQLTYPLKDTSGWAAGQLDRLPTGWRYAYDEKPATCRLLNQPYDPDSELTQYYVIDGFILSPNVGLNSVKTLDEDFVYSDHNPVLMEVTLNP